VSILPPGTVIPSAKVLFRDSLGQFHVAQGRLLQTTFSVVSLANRTRKPCDQDYKPATEYAERHPGFMIKAGA
jgi:hypothetical protein